MKRNRPSENTARVLALAFVFFGGLAALGYAGGVFARLGTETVISLAVFALAFCVLTYRLDPAVRAFVDRLAAPRAAAPRKRDAGRPAPV
jgi:hypothetical protein